VNPLTFWYDKFMLSGHLRPFFWEIDTDHFDPMLYPQYTIARLLEFGDPDAISWLREQFPEETIKNVIRADRTLSPRSANFWALVYGIPSEDVAALKV